MIEAAGDKIDNNEDACIQLQKAYHRTDKVDFALAFWMAHEVPDARAFFMQIKDILKPGAYILLAEPKMHVSRSRYEEIVRAASEVGLKPDSEQEFWISRAMLFTNANPTQEK